LRVAEAVATSLPEAVRLIRGRLRRCRQASLYRLPDGFGWGECFDTTDGQELEAGLQKAHELPATVATVLRTAALVARQRGQEILVADYVLRAGHYQEPGRPVLIRDGRNWQRCLRRRLWLHWGLAAVLAGVLSVLPWSPILLGVSLAGLLACCAHWWRHYLRRRWRFQMQTAAAAFRVPREKATDTDQAVGEKRSTALNLDGNLKTRSITSAGL
jgi:hypothetical protein